MTRNESLYCNGHMIEVVTNDNFESLLLLMKMYQEFYEINDIDEDRNREFFSQFLGGDEAGAQFLLYENNNAVAFATVYFSFASSVTSKVAILSDLYTLPTFRGKGYGKALIAHCAEFAKTNKCNRLQWFAQSNNTVAQGLYDKVCTYSGDWIVYAITT